MAWAIFSHKKAALKFKREKNKEGYITTIYPIKYGFEVHYHKK